MPEPTPALRAAREFAARSWRPFPVDHPSLPACAAPHRRRPCDGKRGKHPVSSWGTQTASIPTDAMLRLWFGSGPRNIGIAAGPSGLLILDEDETDALTNLAEILGEPLPSTYRVMTARGWHWYFADPNNEFGNTAGVLADHGIDVRGGHGDGGYVVAAGSRHQTGVEYLAEDSAAEVAPLPEWIKTLIRTPSAAKRAQEGAGERPKNGWTDEPRYGRPDLLRAQYDRHLAACNALVPAPGRTPNGGEFRHALYLAALDGWRLVDCGLIDELTMLRQIRETIVRVWEAEPDDDDRTIVYEEAREKATASPWVVLDPLNASDSSALEPDAFEQAVEAEVRKLKIAEAARRQLAEERNAHRPRIADNVVNDLDSIEAPLMLIESLIPESAVGFVAGRSGAYKSFLAVSWACSVATGRPWLDRPEFAVRRPLKTLYVAAEGPAGAAGRMCAWEAATGISRRDKLLLYRRPIHLNDIAQVDELVAYVAEHQFQFVVIDTYHRASPGVDENNSTEFGVVFAAAARLRDDCECGVLFVDHTGHAGGGRPRGSSAKGDDADYVLSAGYDGASRGPEVQRMLTVNKLKDEESGAEWPLRLVPVEGQHFPVIDIGTTAARGPFGPHDDLREWWRPDVAPEVTPDVVEKIQQEVAKSGNRGADAARWIWRYLTLVDDEQGVTRSQIERALGTIPREHPFTSAAIEKAIPLLDRAGLVGRDRSRVWLQ